MRILYTLFIFLLAKVIFALALGPTNYVLSHAVPPVSLFERALVVTGMMPMALFATWWVIQRLHQLMNWSMPGAFISPRSHAGDWLLTIVIGLLVPSLVLASALSSPYADRSADLRWPLVPASLWCVGWIAFAEEFLYRKILLGEFLKIADQRIGWCIAALLAQAAIFAAFHCIFAFVTPGHFLFYFLGGCLLGWIYWIHQNIWLNALLHLVMNVSVAQIGPIRYWFAGRVAQFASDQWHDWFTASAVLLLTIYFATLPFRKTEGREKPRPWYEDARG
ncbi:hypothetical protein CDN99_08880 [Roseateles aquatilis]|uniref:CAAX prenyl protease 2/Lysostaphin resistance protein A-like domain-containing protein n=1 Tax=Roseateles aquatilis TaxID=431061 RepID=A0A246JFA3_9BURK|nr:CPBP family intramembrane glutamic endopeptidase [Roseateles aquatilis]OWQ91282.1 hypothetical protein CDN99_08880 [Roseateles aquatilis]